MIAYKQVNAMAKDDYFVIAYKILAYLYMKLKAGEDIDPEMLQNDSELLQINRKFWFYIMRNIQEQGYISRVRITGSWGGEIVRIDLSDCQITPAGIEYLCDNKLFEKVKAFLKELKEITPFI